MIATLPEDTLRPEELIRLLSAAEGSLDWAVGMRHEVHAHVRRDRAYAAHCLGALLRTRGWRRLTSAGGKPFGSFLDFCRAPRPHGLGLTRGEVEKLGALLD